MGLMRVEWLKRSVDWLVHAKDTIVTTNEHNDGRLDCGLNVALFQLVCPDCPVEAAKICAELNAFGADTAIWSSLSG